MWTESDGTTGTVYTPLDSIGAYSSVDTGIVEFSRLAVDNME